VLPATWGASCSANLEEEEEEGGSGVCVWGGVVLVVVVGVRGVVLLAHHRTQTRMNCTGTGSPESGGGVGSRAPHLFEMKRCQPLSYHLNGFNLREPPHVLRRSEAVRAVMLMHTQGHAGTRCSRAERQIG
jgi:hypothetical protein